MLGMCNDRHDMLLLSWCDAYYVKWRRKGKMVGQDV